MLKTCALLALAIQLLSAYSPPVHSANARAVSVDAFAALPSFSAPKLSPTGEKLAYFIEKDGKRNLIVGRLDGSTPLLVSPPEKQTFSSFVWKNETTILYTTSLSLKRRSLMVRTKETRVHRLDLTTNKTRWLGAPNRTNFRETTGQNERIIDMLPHDPEHILLELDLNRSGTYEVYKSNLDSGHRKLIQREQDNIQSWVTDSSGTVRLAYGFDNDERIARINLAGDDWVNLYDFPWGSQYKIEGFSERPSIVYVSGANKYGLTSLYTLDTSTGKVIDTLFSHSSFDMDYPVISPHTGAIIGAAYTNDFQHIEYFDKSLAAIQRSIDRAMPDTINTIVSISTDRALYFVYVQNAKNPGDYYLYNRSKGTLAYIAPSRTNITPELSANTRSVTIPMSDSTSIPGYLTIPTDATSPEKLPTVILPHGGPFGVRDTAAWDYEAQFYASRGYLVLKPNFRGSGGYGTTFLKAGFNQWGGRMQDDVTDATKWLINEGYADPERICIVGSSYGGYAALMGAILQPDLYQCAASINGVTDLLRMKGNDRIYAIGGRTWSSRWGLEGADEETVSPYHRADDINVPVLLMASLDDARVPFKLSDAMHKRLKKLGKESKFVRIKDGTHDMVTANARQKMLKEVGAFLDRRIGPNSYERAEKRNR